MSLYNGEASVVCPSVSVCKLLRKSLLLPGKWPDRDQTCTRWSPSKPASRLCSRSRSRSKVTWYPHFLGFLEWATPSLTVWFTLVRRSWSSVDLTWFFCSRCPPSTQKIVKVRGHVPPRAPWGRRLCFLLKLMYAYRRQRGIGMYINWLSIMDGDRMGNNFGEACNRRFKSLLGHSHPSVWSVIEALQRLQQL